MSAQPPPLPPGWHAQWDQNANRYAFVDSATGQAQWNHPSAGPPPGPPQPQVRRHASRPSLSSPAPPPQHQPTPPPGQQQQQPGLRPQTSQHQLRHQPSFNMSAPPLPGAQHPPGVNPAFDRVGSPNNGFTSPPLPALPGQSASPQLGAAPVVRGSRRQYAANTAAYVAGDTAGAGVGHGGQYNGHQQQQQAAYPQQQDQQPAFFSPADPQAQQYGGTQGGYPEQGGYGGQQQQQGGAYAGGQAAYAGVGQQAMAGMSQQFGNMGIGAPSGPQTVNLVGMQLNPAELATLQPPPINLPPHASFTDHPLRNADPSYQRSTLNAIPANSSLLSKSKVPLALVITPYRSIKADEPEVPVQTDTCIARCRRCRMYINPFVTFIEGGARWKCCVCGLANAVPQLFDWNQETNEQADRYQRPELTHAVVDFVAPTEYMIRPPQPPLFVFLMDVSYAAISSGMVATAARTLLESLDRIPDDDGRTKVSVIGVDSCLHFFTLPAGPSGEPTTLVVGDLDDVFLPKPHDILVSLVEAKAAVENLLGRLSDMYRDTANVGHALGPALQAAFKLLSHVGGKVVALSATLPNLGPGSLRDRTDAKVLGTTKESGLLQAANAWYKTFAIECSRAQISVDLWLFSSAYTDVATLSGLPRYTGGNTYYYPMFNASRSEDALKFAHEFGTVISDPTPFEAVIRVRASKGIRLSAFHGNFFVRSTDLLSLPSVPMDQSYAIELTIDDPITAPFVVLQTGIMHTTAFGERRIRVITQALPVTSSMSELYANVDAVALATLYANKAVERTLQSKMEDAREAVVNKLVDILGTYKATMLGGGKGPSPQLVVAENLKFLPILMLGLLKNLGLRQSSMIPADIRAYAQSLLTTLPSQLLIPYLYPTLYALHTMPPEAGTIGDHGVILPAPLPLTTERFERHGLFLVENGQEIFLWVGSAAVPQLVQDVFGVASYDQLKGGKTMLRPETEFGQRVAAVVGKCREMRRGPYWPHLFVVKETGDGAMAGWMLSLLVEDRQEGLPTYAQFLGQLKDKVNDGKF